MSIKALKSKLPPSREDLDKKAYAEYFQSPWPFFYAYPEYFEPTIPPVTGNNLEMKIVYITLNLVIPQAGRLGIYFAPGLLNLDTCPENPPPQGVQGNFGAAYYDDLSRWLRITENPSLPINQWATKEVSFPGHHLFSKVRCCGGYIKISAAQRLGNGQIRTLVSVQEGREAPDNIQFPNTSISDLENVFRYRGEEQTFKLYFQEPTSTYTAIQLSSYLANNPVEITVLAAFFGPLKASHPLTMPAALRQQHQLQSFKQSFALAEKIINSTPPELLERPLYDPVQYYKYIFSGEYAERLFFPPGKPLTVDRPIIANQMEEEDV